MKRTEISRRICQGVACLCVAWTMTSCSEGIKSGEESNDKGGGCGVATNAACAVAPVERTHVLTQEERFVAEFKHLVVLKRVRTGEKSTQKVINELCNEISSLPREQALPLLDQFVDMAISQQVTETGYNSRLAWYAQLFYVVHDAFCFAQYLQKESFERWDKLFSFFAKYTDEIASVKKTLPATDWKYWSWKDIEKGTYLSRICSDFKTWVHVMRDFYFPELSKGLTEEQKADVLRRFDELKKYMDTPPNFPGGKK